MMKLGDWMYGDAFRFQDCLLKVETFRKPAEQETINPRFHTPLITLDLISFSEQSGSVVENLISSHVERIVINYYKGIRRSICNRLVIDCDFDSN